MRLLPAVVAGLLWHLFWVWVGIGDAWVSLLILVGVAGLLASASALAQVIAWAWLRDALSKGASLVEAATRLLPGGDDDDDDWAAVAPVLTVLASVAGFGLVQFVDLMAEGDVVARIVLLAAALVLLGIDVAAGVWGVGESRAPPIVQVSGGEKSDGEGGLSASVPLPAALGGGEGRRLRFVLDV